MDTSHRVQPRISRTRQAPISALRRRLRELGYVEGQNLVIESRYAEGAGARLSSLAAELVHLKVAVIVTWGPGVSAAKDTTSTIPIVMASTLDAVEDGFITSLARPGGNITGLILISTELMGKRLELLWETFPSLRRLALLVARLGGTRQPSIDRLVRATEAAAKSLGLELQVLHEGRESGRPSGRAAHEVRAGH